MPRVNQIQLRRDAAGTWTSVNPVLAAGEIGLETDTRLMKAGDGTTAWASLPYVPAQSANTVSNKSFMVQTTQPTTRPGGAALVTGDVWISYTA
jgi:hypothetical protein